MMKYQIWSEGYEATGNSGSAELLGEVEADDFASACSALFEGTDREKYFNKQRLTYWGCRLFDNEQDAKKSFG
ncbi:hypothetical protein ACVY1S_002049 [Salmonella enterica subsp. enterica]|nr:hypothetical protein [Salmonella enterica subsp. enterica serovar Aba]EDK8480236.1 hypothetical protein [Salmonella enterica subsp. enterica serovar Chailey]EEP5169893.1 hypothetical protein [Salmonella enterica subsp. enterica serovar Aba]